jgi:hypothetical protein
VLPHLQSTEALMTSELQNPQDLWTLSTLDILRNFWTPRSSTSWATPESLANGICISYTHFIKILHISIQVDKKKL